MKRYLIERSLPEATDAAIAEFTRKSNIAIASLGVPYRWITSYVAGDSLYCIHEAEDEDVVREQLRRCGMRATKVAVVDNEFGPRSAESAVS